MKKSCNKQEINFLRFDREVKQAISMKLIVVDLLRWESDPVGLSMKEKI